MTALRRVGQHAGLITFVIPRSVPTERLAVAIHTALSSGKNHESNAILFKFAWRLFTRDDNGDKAFVKLGEQALSAGRHLICAIEKSIRFSKGGKKYLAAREMCFKAMIENMGPRGGEIKYDGFPYRACRQN